MALETASAYSDSFSDSKFSEPFDAKTGRSCDTSISEEASVRFPFEAFYGSPWLAPDLSVPLPVEGMSLMLSSMDRNSSWGSGMEEMA